MPFDLVEAEVLPPPEEDFEAVPEDFVPPPEVFADLPPLVLLFESAVLALDEADDLAVFDDFAGFESVFAAALDLPAAPPAVFDFAPPVFAFAPPVFSSVSTSVPTASAATFNALTAAPVAAPIRISPATSAALSKIGEEELFLVDFFGVDFDFAEDAADFEDFDAAGFAGDALFALVFVFADVEVFAACFWFSFFVAIFYLPLI